MILGVGAEHVQKHKNAWCFKVIFNKGSWVSIRSNGIGVEERHPLKTLLAALWRISNWLVRHFNLLLFLVTHSTLVLFFVSVIFTQVCDNGSCSSTFSKTFTMANFVVTVNQRYDQTGQENLYPL